MKNIYSKRDGYSIIYTIFYISIALVLISSFTQVLSSGYRIKYASVAKTELKEVAFATKDKISYDMDNAWNFKFYSDSKGNNEVFPDENEYMDIKKIFFNSYSDVEKKNNVYTTYYYLNPGGNLYVLSGSGKYQLANYVSSIQVKKISTDSKGYILKIKYTLIDQSTENSSIGYKKVDKKHIDGGRYIISYTDEFLIYPCR